MGGLQFPVLVNPGRDGPGRADVSEGPCDLAARGDAARRDLLQATSESRREPRCHGRGMVVRLQSLSPDDAGVGGTSHRPKAAMLSRVVASVSEASVLIR